MGRITNLEVDSVRVCDVVLAGGSTGERYTEGARCGCDEKKEIQRKLLLRSPPF